MKDPYIEAIEIWDDFKSELIYKNRFISKHKILKCLKESSENIQFQINENTILYRARIFNKEIIYNMYEANQCLQNDKNYYVNFKKPNNDFRGYSKEESFVPPDNDNISDGRTNPAYIKYLYTAEEPYTALVEVRPSIDNIVSVAEIKVNKQLRIADLSRKSYLTPEYDNENGYIMNIIARVFSEVINDKKNYIPMQYVAEFIKSLGFDGIRFDSSLDRGGMNVTIFNYDDCVPISSKLYRVDTICYGASCIAPSGKDELVHNTLKDKTFY